MGTTALLTASCTRVPFIRWAIPNRASAAHPVRSAGALGPWKLFYRDDDWGTYGDYQPNFPTKWMAADGRLLYMVSSGSWDDYNFVVQKMALKLKGEADFPPESRLFRYRRT